ncbi:hypothetical protein KUL42_01850 [Alteromonas sp. KUL42]|nr:hypothetical protein KUL42_01850 [Alteromonas sp. KUL42]
MMSAAPKLSELFAARHDAKAQVSHPYDVTLILIALALMSIGIIIVTSASMPVADRLHDNPFYFAIRHGIYIVGAIVAAMVVLQLPMQFWRMSNPYLLLAAIGLLVAVLLIGRTVNGSTRWLAIGPITIQAAEPAKLFFFAYLAGYLVRRYEEVTENLKGFIKPLVVVFCAGYVATAATRLRYCGGYVCYYHWPFVFGRCALVAILCARLRGCVGRSCAYRI